MKYLNNNLQTGIIKKVNLFTLCLTLFSFTLLMQSCKDKDDPTPANPSITVTSPTDGASIIAGRNVDLKFSVTSGAGIKKILVKYKASNGNETTRFDSSFASQPTAYNFSRTYVVGAIGTETYTIVVTDKNDNLDTKSVNIKSVTGFSNEDFGSYFHILGSLPGAFDLVKAEQRVVTDADADKDMVNTDGAGVFTGKWESKNNTKFVRANTFNATTGTVDEAMSAYDNGVPSTTISNPIANDVYIARIRNTNTYAVIKIITNDALNNECGCNNKGKLSFTFKKSL